MGRPIGSVNREKPFNDALRIALRGDPLRLRRIADKLADIGGGGRSRQPSGNLPIAWTGSPRRSSIGVMLPIEELTDAELHLIASGGLPVPQNSLRCLLIPPPAKDKA